MRIFYQQDSNYLSSLAATLKKDPASLEGWWCMHFRPQTETACVWPEDVLKKLREDNVQSDCDIVVCDDGDIFCVGRMPEPMLLHKLAAMFTELMDCATSRRAEYAIFDMLLEWRDALAVLQAKAEAAPVYPLSSTEVNFGEVGALAEVFAEAKKRRQSRMPLHIMVVEDDVITRRIVTGTFKEHYAVITAVNAQEAVAGYLMHAPDIVFLDIGLPDASGFDVLRRIMECDPDAYIVMFSGNCYLDNITRALSTGASGFVSKPFKRDRMQSYIEMSALHHRKFA